jgi:hypothetical protein
MIPFHPTHKVLNSKSISGKQASNLAAFGLEINSNAAFQLPKYNKKQMIYIT